MHYFSPIHRKEQIRKDLAMNEVVSASTDETFKSTQTNGVAFLYFRDKDKDINKWIQMFLFWALASPIPACSLYLWTLVDQWGFYGLLELLLVVPQSLQRLLGSGQKRGKKCIFHQYNLLKCFPLHILGPTSQIHLNTLHSSPCWADA